MFLNHSYNPSSQLSYVCDLLRRAVSHDEGFYSPLCIKYENPSFIPFINKSNFPKVFINSSISPALTNHLNGVIKDTADFYPTWTESTWDTPNPIKLFLLPTKTIESVTLAIGICIFIISFVFTFLANKYLSRWLLEGEEVESLNNNNY